MIDESLVRDAGLLTGNELPDLDVMTFTKRGPELDNGGVMPTPECGPAPGGATVGGGGSVCMHRSIVSVQ